MPGRLASGHRAMWIIIGILVIAVAGLSVALITKGGGTDEPGQPATELPPGLPTSSSPARPSGSALPSLPVKTVTVSSLPSLIGSDPTMSTIGAGSTDPTDFARRVATALLSYDWRTDFQSRNDDLMLLAAPDPYGDASGLRQDIAAMTPTGAALSSIQQQGSAVTLGSVQVQESHWGRQRLLANGAPAGVHGMEVSGVQTFKEPGQESASSPVTVSMVVVCPPTTDVCALTRVYPGTLQDALGG